MISDDEQWVWKFLSHIDHRGRSAVQDWYEAQPENVKAEFDTRFKYLRVAKDTEWCMPYTKQLHGKCKEFIEVRFKVNRNQYRAIGFTSTNKVFTVVRITDKHDFDASCSKEATRKSQILKDRSYEHEPECFSDIAEEAKEQGLP